MRTFRHFLFIVILIFLGRLFSQDFKTSSFNQKWLQSIISIEREVKGKYQPIGTGFLISSPNNHVVIITAKHVVIDDNGNLHKNIGFRVNRKNGKSKVYSDNFASSLTGNKWIFSKKYDIACHIFAYDSTAKILVIPYKSLLKSNQLETGAPLLIPGFPLGLRSPDYPDPIVRQGTVALINENNILIDALLFSGNSGGPVLYVPLFKVDNKTLKSPLLNEEMVIGLVSSYISYIDAAVSKQTKRTRITFEENSGLCNVIPSEAIIDLLNSKDLVLTEKSLK